MWNASRPTGGGRAGLPGGKHLRRRTRQPRMTAMIHRADHAAFGREIRRRRRCGLPQAVERPASRHIRRGVVRRRRNPRRFDLLQADGSPRDLRRSGRLAPPRIRRVRGPTRAGGLHGGHDGGGGAALPRRAGHWPHHRDPRSIQIRTDRPNGLVRPGHRRKNCRDGRPRGRRLPRGRHRDRLLGGGRHWYRDRAALPAPMMAHRGGLSRHGLGRRDDRDGDGPVDGPRRFLRLRPVARLVAIPIAIPLGAHSPGGRRAVVPRAAVRSAAAGPAAARRSGAHGVRRGGFRQASPAHDRPAARVRGWGAAQAHYRYRPSREPEEQRAALLPDGAWPVDAAERSAAGSRPRACWSRRPGYRQARPTDLFLPTWCSVSSFSLWKSRRGMQRGHASQRIPDITAWAEAGGGNAGRPADWCRAGGLLDDYGLYGLSVRIMLPLSATSKSGR